MWFLILTLMIGEVQVEIGWERNLDEIDVYRARVVAVAEDGTLALIDRDQRHLVILNPAGELKARVTALGQGPGELQNPVELTYCPMDQTFAILDFGNVRLSKWSKNGQLHSEYAMPRNFFRPLFGEVSRIFFLRDPFGLEQSEPSLLSWQLGTDSPRKVWGFQPKEPFVFSKLGGGPDAGNIVWRWNPALIYGKGKDFLAVGHSGQPQVHLLTLDGQTMGQPIQVELPTYPVTDAQIEAAFDLMPADMTTGLRAGLVKPKAWPTMRNILVDGADRIWVIGAAPDLHQAHPFQVFTEHGKSLGKGKVAAMPLAMTTRAFYYLRGDEDLFLVKALVRLPS